RDQVRLQAHVAQTSDRAGGVVGVQRAENDVASQRRLHGNLRRFQVADLADQDLVGVLTQDRAQGRGERQANFVVDRALHDAVDLVLDRVLGRDDLVANDVQLVQRRIERGRLAGAGGAGDENDAVGLLNDRAELFQDFRLHADLVQVERHHGAVQHADDNAFAEHGGQDADAHVHRVAADVQLDATVLWQAALGNVQVGHDLDAAGDGHGQVARRRHHFVQDAVAAIAHLVLVLERLEMDVAGLVLDAQQEDHVDELAHGRFVGQLQHVLEVDAGFLGAAAELGVGLQLGDHVHDALFLAGVGLGKGFGDGGRWRELGNHLADAQKVAQIIDGGSVIGVADGDGQHL